MTLAVNVFYVDESGKQQMADLGSGGHLAGFEETRHDFWSASIMIDIGLKILPRMSNEFLQIDDVQQLSELKSEALTIQDNLQTVVGNTTYDEQFVISRTNNIIKAVEYAQKYNGRVTIG